MAQFFDPVVFEIKAKATEAIATFKQVNSELGKMESSSLKAGGAITSLEKTARLTKTAFLAVGGAIGALGIASLKTLGDVQKSQVSLQVAVENSGVNYKTAQPFIDKYAKSMSDLGFTTSETYDALAKMTTASGSPKMALESLGVAADLARYKNISLAEAGVLINKAFLGGAKGLDDLGLALGKTLPKGASFEEILAAIEERAGGLSKRFAETLPGSIAVTNAKFEEMKTQIGTALLPYAMQFTNWMTETAIPKMGEMLGWVDKNKTGLTNLGMALGGLWLGGKIVTGITAVTGAVRALSAALGVLVIAGGGLAALLTSPWVGLAAAVAGVGIATYNVFRDKDKTPKLPTKSASQFYKPGMPAIQGSGVKTYTPPTSSNVTVNQNITVYTHNANDLSTQLILKAKNGTTLGIRALDTIAAVGSTTKGFAGSGFRGAVMT